MKYDSKISTLEERDDLSSMTMDQLHGILTAYKMRTWQNKTSKGEAAFKVTKKTKHQKQNTQNDHNEEYDEEEANFIKKLQKGSGKYKGKLPFKCFNCGKIGHFQSKCPYSKKDFEDEDAKSKQYKKGGKPDYKKNHKGKKNFYSKEEEDSSSSKVSDSEDEVLFVGIEESDDLEEIEHKKESKDEVEINVKKELFYALDGLKRYKSKYRQLKNYIVEQEE